ncbi:carbohydrate esterase family 4 protein [Mucidula mucida]|nr:carbohydrate esterase family 4 protein [Mucidula mucida]
MKFFGSATTLLAVSVGLAAAAPQSKRLPNTAAITFDDGPYDYMSVLLRARSRLHVLILFHGRYDIVNTLNSKNAKATFFFQWQQYRCIYDSDSQDRVKYAYNNGHQVASHTWSHANLATLSWDQINDEMWRVEQALERIVGVTPAYMRPPYGSFNDQVVSAASQRGQDVVIWDFDSGDSTGSSADQSKQAYTDKINEHPSSILALNHEVYSTTAYDVIPNAIDQLQAAGYNLVTLAECLGTQPYQNVGQPGSDDGSWTC